MRRLTLFILFLMCITLSFNLATAQDALVKPLGLPLDMPPGPSTWLLGQPYGNTLGAFNFGTAWYSAGQGLHFGIDVSMPCGTPLVAVADGDVIYVDNMAFGAGPHNLILRHEAAGVTTLYGHLLNKPPLSQFQPVKRGQLVGYSGDPDVTCDSRPHLHLEVRSLDYRTAYNPIDYIDAPWHTLAAIGSFQQPSFQQDLMNAGQWMSLDNQPPTAFGGARVNAYAQTWPPANNERPPANALLPRQLDTLSTDTPWTLRSLGYDNCCAVNWWHPTDPNRLYTVDGAPGTLADVYEWDVNPGGMAEIIADAPPPMLSPDGTHQVIRANGVVSIRRLSDGIEWTVDTRGFTPSISADNTRLMWMAQFGQDVPGATPPLVEIWVSNLDGTNAQQIVAQADVSARWLDGSRLLISSSSRTLTTLSVYDTRDASTFTLGTWDRLRGLSVAPGGGRVLFYQTFQPDTAVNGVYTMETINGAVPEKLDWFGAWRWRDANSLYYIPFEPASAVQTLAYYDIGTRESRLLTDPLSTPFTVMNGDWSVSADGRRIVFMNAVDRRLWLLEQGL